MTIPSPTSQTRFQRLMLGLFSCVAGAMLLDFSWPGVPVHERVEAKEAKLQRHYNAGGNSYVSYRLQTRNRDLTVDKEVAAQVAEGQLVQFWISPLFQEVNAYQLATTEQKKRPTLRILTGLVFPVVALLAFFLGYTYKQKVGTLVFVMQVLVFINFAYLLS